MYTSSLTKEEFTYVEPLLPHIKTTKPRKWTWHEIWNAILYVDVTGCQRRNIPTDLVPRKTAYHYFRIRKQQGVYEKILAELHKQLRKKNREKGKT